MRQFLLALSTVVDNHRDQLTDIEMLALVTAWCMVQGSGMSEEEYDTLANHAAAIAVRLGPVPDRLN